MTADVSALWYRGKGGQYFSGVRADILARLEPATGLKILEIGCGDGSTGAEALRRGLAAEYCGVELFEDAANTASKELSTVVTGNVENCSLPWPDEYFDAVIASEVLEHLLDPWATVANLHRLMKPGGRIFASSPNVCFHRVIRMLLKGRFDLESKGVMDRTHFRWFTPATYEEMFREAGFESIETAPLNTFGWKARVFSRVLPPSRRVLLWSQTNLAARKPSSPVSR